MYAFVYIGEYFFPEFKFKWFADGKFYQKNNSNLLQNATQTFPKNQTLKLK